jgi:hypothetical protein
VTACICIERHHHVGGTSRFHRQDGRVAHTADKDSWLLRNSGIRLPKCTAWHYETPVYNRYENLKSHKIIAASCVNHTNSQTRRQQTAAFLTTGAATPRCKQQVKDNERKQSNIASLYRKQHVISKQRLLKPNTRIKLGCQARAARNWIPNTHSAVMRFVSLENSEPFPLSADRPSVHCRLTMTVFFRQNPHARKRLLRSYRAPTASCHCDSPMRITVTPWLFHTYRSVLSAVLRPCRLQPPRKWFLKPHHSTVCVNWNMAVCDVQGCTRRFGFFGPPRGRLFPECWSLRNTTAAGMN